VLQTYMYFFQQHYQQLPKYHDLCNTVYLFISLVVHLCGILITCIEVPGLQACRHWLETNIQWNENSW